MKDINQEVFDTILTRLHEMSQEELLQALEDTPDTGVGYAITGMDEEIDIEEAIARMKKYANKNPIKLPIDIEKILD